MTVIRKNLSVEVQLVKLKYSSKEDYNISTDKLIELLHKEFGHLYSKEDILSLDVDLTECEISNKQLEYDYHNRYSEDYR